MNDDQWAAIDLQRARIADLLDDLSVDEWAAASLCEGWTVRDVAAHLTLQQLRLRDGLALMLRHPGDVNHVIHHAAKDRARRPTGELVAGIRGTIGSRRHNVGLSPRETLVDIVVHGQDIAVPLGRELDVDPAAAVAAAHQVWSYYATRRGRRLARVFRPLPYADRRLTATDADWSVGEGPELRGPIVSLLLVLTGRPAGLADLTGDGAARWTTHLDDR